MESAAPKNISKYEVIGQLGRGGMGVVYKAIDRTLNRVVAIKMLTNREGGPADALKRFYREAQFTANLRHPNIVTVYDLGEFEDTPFLVMEFLDGHSLDSMLAHGQISLLRAVNFARQVCIGLDYAHTRQPSIVHRDIKPANLMVIEDHLVKIVDFGIARLAESRMTRSGQLMGSYHYMSPEQISDAELDGRTDIFSTGVVLYQLLTTKLPFDASGFAQTLNRILGSPPPPLNDFIQDYPPELDEIVGRALAKHPGDRYQTASEFAFDLLEVEERLRQHLFGSYLDKAEYLIREQKFEAARQELADVLMVDQQNVRAKELLRQIQQADLRQQRKERSHTLRAQAEKALDQNRFAEALSSLEQALKLDDTNSELHEVRDKVAAMNASAQKLNEVLASAERACASRNLDDALRAVNEALQLEPGSVRAKSFKAVVDAKIAERESERRVQTLLDEARARLASRQFREALHLLGEARSLNPNISAVHDLVRMAETGHREELRKRALDRAVAEIREAVDRPQPSLARNLALAALKRFPDEPVLLDLKRTADELVETGRRHRTLSLITAVLAAGDCDAAERQLESARAELGDFPELHRLKEQIQKERIRCAQHEVETALRDAHDLVRFDAESQALVTLEGVAHLLDVLPADLRQHYEQMQSEIEGRLQAEAPETAAPVPDKPSTESPETRTSTFFSQPQPISPPTVTNLPLRPATSVSVRVERQDRNVAELTPAEGIQLPDMAAPAQTTPPLQASSGATSASPGCPWSEDALRDIEKRLAAFIGPLARVIVRKAACTTSDPEQFYAILAAKIENRVDRQAFLSKEVELGPGTSRHGGEQSSVPATTPIPDPGLSAPRFEVTPEAIERATRLLLPYIGPIAGVVVKKTAQQVDTLRQLYVQLAQHIEGASEKNRFLREAGFAQR